MSPDNKGRASLVSVITTPLGFFALSLLIVEGFLGIILVGSNLAAYQKFVGMLIGAGLFVLIVVLVTILVWRRPQNLTFSELSHLEHERALYGAAGKPVSERQLGGVSKVSARAIKQEEEV